MTFSISKFATVLDVPTLQEVAWEDFVGLFLDPVATPCTLLSCAGPSCTHKRGPCWSPATFTSNGSPRGGVSAISLLVFDVERVTDTQLYDIRKHLGDYRYLIHATHSDRPQSHCVHIIMPLSRSVSREAWGAFWKAAQQLLVPVADPACADAGRIYFLPRIPRDAGYFTQVNEGKLLDVDVVLATALRAEPQPVVEGGVA